MQHLSHLDGVYRVTEDRIVELDSPPETGLVGIQEVAPIFLQDIEGSGDGVQVLWGLGKGSEVWSHLLRNLQTPHPTATATASLAILEVFYLRPSHSSAFALHVSKLTAAHIVFQTLSWPLFCPPH